MPSNHPSPRRVGSTTAVRWSMRPKLVVAFALVPVSLFAACGDRDTAEPLGAPPPPSVSLTMPASAENDALAATIASAASAASAAPTDTTTTDVVEAATTAVEVTNLSVVDGVSFDTIGVVPEAQSPMFDGDVRTDDPLPEQTDAITDPDLAEIAVRYAYQHWILIDLDKDLRGRLVENGEENADRIAETMEANRGLISCARIPVNLVQFTDAEHALVKFDMNCGSGRSGYFPNELSGSAIYQNGTWRITGKTLCLLAFGSGLDCSRLASDDVVSPAAFELNVVPNGYSWTGGPVANVFATDSTGFWQDAATGQTLSISAEELAGVSGLDATDADFVLSSPRFMTAGGAALLVGDRPGRAEQIGTSASLAYLRADDVIVHIWASDSTVAQLVAVATAVTPTDAVPSAPEHDGTVVGG